MPGQPVGVLLVVVAQRREHVGEVAVGESAVERGLVEVAGGQLERLGEPEQLDVVAGRSRAARWSSWPPSDAGALSAGSDVAGGDVGGAVRGAAVRFSTSRGSFRVMAGGERPAV